MKIGELYKTKVFQLWSSSLEEDRNAVYLNVGELVLFVKAGRHVKHSGYEYLILYSLRLNKFIYRWYTHNGPYEIKHLFPEDFEEVK